MVKADIFDETLIILEGADLFSTSGKLQFRFSLAQHVALPTNQENR